MCAAVGCQAPAVRPTPRDVAPSALAAEAPAASLGAAEPVEVEQRRAPGADRAVEKPSRQETGQPPAFDDTALAAAVAPPREMTLLAQFVPSAPPPPPSSPAKPAPPAVPPALPQPPPLPQPPAIPATPPVVPAAPPAVSPAPKAVSPAPPAVSPGPTTVAKPIVPAVPGAPAAAVTAALPESGAAKTQAGVAKSPANPAAIKALAQQAFELTKTAETYDDVSRIITLCTEITASATDEGTATYAARLASWAYNRRGELQAYESNHNSQVTKTDKLTALETAALNDFNRALTLDSTRWRAYHNRGVSLAQVGRLEEALADFNKALELHTEYANTWFNRGEVYLSLGQYEAAVRDYNAALRLLANDPGALLGRGHALARLGKHREALADYEAVRKLDAGYREYPLDRANSLAALGELEEAARLYRSAIDTLKTGRAYRAAAWFMCVCPDRKYIDAPLALEAAQRAIELDGDRDYRYLHTLAMALWINERDAEAFVTMERAILGAPPARATALREDLARWQKAAAEETAPLDGAP